MKTITALLFFLCGLGTTFAQSGIGLRAGVNRSDWLLKGESVTEIQSQDGLVMGFLLETRLDMAFSFESGLEFIQKGATLIDQIKDDHYQEKIYKIEYLNMPLFGKFRFGAEKFKFHFLFGPSVGYAVNGKVHIEDYDANGKISQEETALHFGKEDFNRIDLGLNLGVGMSIYLPLGYFFAEIKREFGSTTIQNNLVTGIKTYNMGVQLAAGYMWPMRYKKATNAPGD